MIPARVIAKIIAALGVGIFFALLWMQYDSRLHDFAHERVRAFFKKEYGVQFCAQTCQLHPFSLSVVLEKVRVESYSHSNWSWSAQEVRLKLDLFHILKTKMCGICMLVTNIDATTSIDHGDIALVDHIEMLIDSPSSGFFDLKWLQLDNINVVYKAVDMPLEGTLSGSVITQKNEKTIETSVKIDDGTLLYGSVNYISDAQGVCQIITDEQDKTSLELDYVFKSPQLPDEDRYLCQGKFSWDINKKTGSCLLATQDQSLRIHPCTISQTADRHYIYDVTVQSSFFILQKILFPELQEPLDGTCTVRLKKTETQDLAGDLTIQQFSYKKYAIENGHYDFSKEDKDLHFEGTCDSNNVSIAATVDYNVESQQGAFTLSNETDAPLYGYWTIAQNNAHITGEFSNNGLSNLEFKLDAFHTKTDESVTSSGKLHCDPEESTLAMLIDSYNITCTFDHFPSLPTSILCYNKSGKEMLRGQFDQKKQFTLSMDYDLVRGFVKAWYDFILPGQGQCNITGSVESDQITGKVLISDALIRLPKMYNFISQAELCFTYQQISKRFEMHDILFNLHKGTISSKRGVLQLPSDQQSSFIHIPLHCYHCFVNLNKEIHGMLTGSLLYQYKNDQGTLDGFCNIDQMAIKDNIFKSELYELFKSDESTLDKNNPIFATKVSIALRTQEPATIITPIIKTQATFNGVLHNTLEDLVCDGTLSLQGGEIIFPAYALSINRGTIKFNSDQLQKHKLDILAQGRAKKYLISMLIAGSLEDPSITFNAKPSLTQEQILMLLFAGTEEQSLNVMAPALLMYNAHNFLFNKNSVSVSTVDSYANSLLPAWMRSFKKIAFIPKFTDQTGRGGLKGAIEIEFNERLRGSIEKNFSLSENFSAEVEYLLSDDVSLRATRDDRGDLGAEVEMRFKF